MVKRHNHYEVAFEDYLRAERIPYVAVNEQRRALDSDGSLKNLDFILSPDASLPAVADESWLSAPDVEEGMPYQPTEPCNIRWLIDVKGRQFPSGSQYWRNWTTADELDSLNRWRLRFGKGFDAALVFAYQLMANRSPVPVEQIHHFRGNAYAFVAVRLDDYWSASRTLSPSWGTVSVPTSEFRQRAQPLSELLGARPMGPARTISSQNLAVSG